MAKRTSSQFVDYPSGIPPPPRSSFVCVTILLCFLSVDVHIDNLQPEVAAGFYCREQSSHCRVWFSPPRLGPARVQRMRGALRRPRRYGVLGIRQPVIRHCRVCRGRTLHLPVIGRRDKKGRGRESVKGKKRQTWWRGGAASAAD